MGFYMQLCDYHIGLVLIDHHGSDYEIWGIGQRILMRKKLHVPQYNVCVKFGSGNCRYGPKAAESC